MARDKEFAHQVDIDYTKANLNQRERLLADMAVKITRAVDSCSPRDVERMREAGLKDEDILSLVEIVAYQNMSTRLMESLSTVD